MAEYELMPGQTPSEAQLQQQKEQGFQQDQRNDGNDPGAGEGESHKSQKVERPDWLPEKFYDADAGQVRTEDLAKSYRELEGMIRKSKDELKAELKQEAEGEIKRPDSAAEYKVPEIQDVVVEELQEHPMYNWFKDYAFKNNLSQEEFANAVSQYVETQRAEQPNVETEKAKLGENADARIEYVTNWLNRHVTDPEERKLYDQATVTAEGFRSIERMIGRMGGRVPETSDGKVANDMTKEEIRSLMNTRKYFEGDPETVKKVTAWFERNS